MGKSPTLFNLLGLYSMLCPDTDCNNDVLFRLYPGRDKAYMPDVTDEAGNFIDIRGWQFTTTIKRDFRQTDGQAVVVKDTGILSVEDEDAKIGLWHLWFTKEDTAKLRPGTYYTQIVQKHNGVCSTVVHGRVEVIGKTNWREVDSSGDTLTGGSSGGGGLLSGGNKL